VCSSDLAKGKSRVKDAEYECVRLLSLINELLDIEKIEAGMMEMNKQPADLAELVVRGSESVKLLAEAKHVKIEVFGAHARASVDSERLVQVFVNLFSNAVKYSPQGGTISVNIEERDGRATIKIQDQGPGIPKQLLESVFDRFKQAHGGGTGTSGLGLAICKAIVEAHEGKIGVVSEVGNGSLFWLQLPTR
jgi:signal transduction histidine kinase